MQLITKVQDRTLKAKLIGELDHHSASSVKEDLDVMLIYPNIIYMELDLKELTFMDSSGIGVILGRYKTIDSRGGKMYAINVLPQVEKMLKLSGLLKIIEII